MFRFVRLTKLIIILSLFVWPISIAIPSIPHEDVFKYNADGLLSIYNTHSDETIKIVYKDKDGNLLENGVRDIDYIFRCRMTGEQIDMAVELVELIDKIQDHFKADTVELISGYRSPELNNTLRRSGRRVAKRSYHLRGMAADIRIPGVPLRELRDYALSLKAGGVGFYPGPDFVHVDVGPVRTW